MSLGVQPGLWQKGVASLALMLLVLGFVAGYMYAAWERQYIFWDRFAMWFQRLSHVVLAPAVPQSHVQVAAAPMSALLLGLLAKRAGMSA